MNCYRAAVCKVKMADSSQFTVRLIIWAFCYCYYWGYFYITLLITKTPIWKMLSKCVAYCHEDFEWIPIVLIMAWQAGLLTCGLHSSQLLTVTQE